MTNLRRLSTLIAAATFLLVLVGGHVNADDVPETESECEINPNTGSCIVETVGGDAVASSLGDLMKKIFGKKNGSERVETDIKDAVGSDGDGSDDISPDENPDFASLEGRDEDSDQEERSKTIWELLQWGDAEKEKKEGDQVDSDDAVAEPEIDAWGQIMIEAAKARAQQTGKTGFEEKIKIVSHFFDKVHKQFDKAFEGLDLKRFNLLQLFYLLQREESVKNPAWKRRQHRLLDRVNLDQALALSDALYMNAAAYADTCEEIENVIKEFRNGSWVMLNCTTEATPTKPAHFLAVKRQQSDDKKSGFSMPWSSKGEEELEVAFIVRATKDIMDMLTDALLESVPYRGGLAHDGILQSARWLHEEYKDFLPELLKASKLDKLKLWTVGYSLGAGTAALLTMEFNEDDSNIESHSFGFGTPALVTRGLSESAKSTITTVVNDHDCVSRMSGPHVFNAFLRGINYNYVEDALQDFDELVPFLRDNLPLGDTLLSDDSVAKLRSDLETSLRDKFTKHPAIDLSKESQKVELIPPGECIHIYREPGGWAGNFVPCHRFNEMDIVNTMVNDHLLDTDTGYGPTLLNYIRQLKKDWNWMYEYDLMDLPWIQESHAAR